MRKLLVVVAMIAVSLSLLAQSQTPSPAGANGRATAAAPQGRAGGAGQTVGALGQSVRRPPAPTGPVPRLPDGTVDLSGVWVGGGPIGDIEQQGGLKPGEIQLLSWAQKLMEYRKAHESEDPHYYCMPMTIPRTTPYPFRFVQSYTHKAAPYIFMLHEGNIHTYRQIFMDGRKHPAELDPTWLGHSIGWWEDDTLVIDTVGFNDKGWMDHRGHPHTEQLHTIERWTRTDLGHLQNKVTIDDPGAYARPFTATFTARLSDPGDEIREYICQENNQFGIAGGHPNPYAEK